MSTNQSCGIADINYNKLGKSIWIEHNYKVDNIIVNDIVVRGSKQEGIPEHKKNGFNCKQGPEYTLQNMGSIYIYCDKSSIVIKYDKSEIDNVSIWTGDKFISNQKDPVVFEEISL
jgi:hypothetical protein